MNPLTSLIQTLPTFTDALGPTARTTLYDLTTSPASVIVTSGSLLGASSDCALTQLGDLVHTSASPTPPRITVDGRGRSIRTWWTFVTEKSIPVGAVHIEVDVTVWAEANAHLAWLHAAATPSAEQTPLHSDMEELRVELVRAALDRIGVPVNLLLKNHKLAITRELDANGFFLLREAVPYLAAALSVSRHSIYNYLNDIRETNVQPS